MDTEKVNYAIIGIQMSGGICVISTEKIEHADPEQCRDQIVDYMSKSLFLRGIVSLRFNSLQLADYSLQLFFPHETIQLEFQCYNIADAIWDVIFQDQIDTSKLMDISLYPISTLYSSMPRIITPSGDRDETEVRTITFDTASGEVIVMATDGAVAIPLDLWDYPDETNPK